MNIMNWNTKLNLLAAAGILSIGGITGCGRQEADRTTVVTGPPPAASTTTVQTPGGTTTTTNAEPPSNNVNAGPGDHDGTDLGTADAIEKRIVENKQMTGSRIDVVVTGGVATLTGFVQNQQQKALATRAAENTAGVTSVKNKIEIRPTGGAKEATAPKVVTKKVYVEVPKVEKKTVYVPVPTPAKDTNDDTSRDRATDETTDTNTMPRTGTGGVLPRTGTGGTQP